MALFTSLQCRVCRFFPACSALGVTFSLVLVLSHSHARYAPSLFFFSRRPLPAKKKVPEEMQLNVSKKQREMVLLEDSVHTMRSRFNSRFLSLRTIKREILATVAADNRRLREIDAELGEGAGGEGTYGARLKRARHRSSSICMHLVQRSTTTVE